MGRYGKREDHLVVHEQEPFNAETGVSSLDAGPVTATDAFYVRNHGPCPSSTPPPGACVSTVTWSAS